MTPTAIAVALIAEVRCIAEKASTALKQVIYFLHVLLRYFVRAFDNTYIGAIRCIVYSCVFLTRSVFGVKLPPMRSFLPPIQQLPPCNKGVVVAHF